MSIPDLAHLLPDYAKDLKKNLSRIVEDDTLTEAQLWGTILVAALATKHPVVIATARSEAAKHLSAEDMETVDIVHATMAMNNVYYKFVHMADEELYRPLPLKIIKTNLHALKTDGICIEMWALAVSAINGCELCVLTHEVRLREAGIEPPVIAACARTGAVIYATGSVLATEEAASAGLKQAARSAA